MADGTITIDVKVNDSELDNVPEKIGKVEKSASSGGMSISKMAGALGLVKVASAGVDVLKGSMDSAISRFDTMNRFPKIMEQVGFSSKDSSKAISTLSDGIDGLPTKLDDVVRNTQTLAMTTGDLDKSSKVVLGLNNAFLASGSSSEDAERGMTQFNQALSRGKFEGEEWNTMKETMGVGLKEIAKQFGLEGPQAVQQLYDKLQSGEITMDQFSDKLAGMGDKNSKMAQIAKTSSEGIATSFANLGNAVSKNMANIMKSIDNLVVKMTGMSIAGHIDQLKGAINGAGTAIQGFIDNLGKLPQVLPFTPLTMLIFMFENIGSHISTLKKALGDMFEALKGPLANLQPVLANVMFNVNLLLDAFLGAIEKILPAIGNFAGHLINAFTTILPSVQPFIDILKRLFELAGQLLPPVLDALGTLIEGVAKGLAPVMEGIGKALKIIVDVIAQWVETAVIPTLKSFTDWASQNQEIIGWLAQGILGVATAFKVFNGALAVFNTVSGILGALPAIFSAITPIASALGGAISLIGRALGFLANPITLAIGGLVLLTGGFVAAVKGPDEFKRALGQVLDALNPMNWIQRGDEIFAGVGRAFSELGSGISNKVGGAVNDTKRGFNEMTSHATSKASEIKNGVVNAFGELGSGISSKISGAVDGFIRAFNDMKAQAGREVEDIKQTILKIGDIDLWQAGKNIMTGLYNGLVEGFNNFIGSISRMGSDIANAFHANKISTGGNNIQDTGQAGVPTFADDGSGTMGIMSMKKASVAGGGFLQQVSDTLGGGMGITARSKRPNGIADKDNAKPVNVTITNEIHAEWDGKTDIKRTMEEMQTQTIKDMRGVLGGMV